MKDYGTDFLKHLTRFGLNKLVLMGYRSYGMLWCSQARKNNESASTFQFIDLAGVEYEWLDRINETECDGELKVFHVIYTGIDKNKGPELVCMYYFNNLDINYQLEKFKEGTAKCFRYYPKKDIILFGDVRYQVRKGGVVDLDNKYI